MFVTNHVIRVYDLDLRILAEYKYSSKSAATSRLERVERAHKDGIVCVVEY